MGLVNIPYRPSGSDPRAIASLLSNFDAITAEFNGNVDTTNLAASLKTLLGLSSGQGKSIIATEETRTNTAYGTLTTPDRVAGVVMPSDGLMFIGFQGMWKESVQSAARVAIFLGSNQLVRAVSDAASGPTPQEAGLASVAFTDTYKPLFTYPAGIIGGSTAAGAYTGDATTGQVIGSNTTGTLSTTPTGGVCAVFAAAGTYDVTVQFKSSSGSVTVKNRKLWVWTRGF